MARKSQPDSRERLIAEFTLRAQSIAEQIEQFRRDMEQQMSELERDMPKLDKPEG